MYARMSARCRSGLTVVRRVAKCRYNNRIKTFMRDVNAVKKASSDTSRVSTHFNRAIECFWPDKASPMKTRLLETPDHPTLRSSSKYQKVISFRSLVTGAVCVWQECWNLLQTCKRKTVNRESYIDEMTKSLDKLKTDLIREIDGRQYRQVALCVFSLQSIFLHLHARRMSTFIKNPRLLAILNDICSSDPLGNHRSPAVIRVGLMTDGSHRSVQQLQQTNMQLRSNFRIYQRDNIEDFLAHLNEYFRPQMKDSLEKKTWLVCEQGQQYASFLSVIENASKLQGGPKKYAANFCPYICQLLTDSQNLVTGTVCGKFVIKWLLHLPLYLNYTTL